MEIKFFKAHLWTYLRYPFYLIKRKKWDYLSKHNEGVENFSEFNSLLEERFKYLSQGIPKINTNIEIKTSEILEKNFEKEILEDNHKKLSICEFVGKRLILTNPNAAEEFITEAINITEKIYSNYHPNLIELNLIRSCLFMELGDIDNSYRCINAAFLLVLINHSFYSLQMLKVIDSYRLFSLRIEESKEHEIYCEKMEKIIEVLCENFKNEVPSQNDENLIKILFYKMSIIDGLIECSKSLSNVISVENLKHIHSKYEQIIKNNLLNKFLYMPIDELSNIESSCLKNIFYCKYVNIKIKSIYKKENKENIYNEISNLIKIGKKKFGQHSFDLILPYIFLIRLSSTFKDLQKLDELIMNDWCDLVSNCFEENYLLISNYTYKMVRELIFREKDLRIKISNLLNFVGENYENYFQFKEDPSKTENNIFYADMCFLGAYLAREDPKLKPWEIASSAANIYMNLLGITSEKYKKAENLFESLDKKYNK